MTMVEHKSNINLTKDTSYLVLTGELWVVFGEDFRKNLPCYNGTALYFTMKYLSYQNDISHWGNKEVNFDIYLLVEICYTGHVDIEMDLGHQQLKGGIYVPISF